LGYRCIDRDVIVERAASHGVSQEELRDALEKPPGFLDRFSHKRYKYLALIQASLTEEVRTGKVIYHGLAGHLLLGGGRHILRTRIIAPMDFRIRMVHDRLNYTKSEAIAYIQKMDEQRRKWVSYLYGVDWGDPSLYDLVLNLDHMTLETACHIISAAVRQRCFELTPACRRALEDLALASKVRAELAIASSTEGLELEATADNGVVTLKGKLASVDQLAEVRRIATEIPGLVDLNLDGLTPPVQG
ncbi:MAG TPA: cytidylate kinase family protein, partial [Terracidiphilus sp.]|nr:cytidylate kinase family protein [Terracidiphilus sp.]